jgi:hypothetical protein
MTWLKLSEIAAMTQGRLVGADVVIPAKCKPAIYF